MNDNEKIYFSDKIKKETAGIKTIDPALAKRELESRVELPTT